MGFIDCCNDLHFIAQVCSLGPKMPSKQKPKVADSLRDSGPLRTLHRLFLFFITQWGNKPHVFLADLLWL